MKEKIKDGAQCNYEWMCCRTDTCTRVPAAQLEARSLSLFFLLLPNLLLFVLCLWKWRLRRARTQHEVTPGQISPPHAFLHTFFFLWSIYIWSSCLFPSSQEEHMIICNLLFFTWFLRGITFFRFTESCYFSRVQKSEKIWFIPSVFQKAPRHIPDHASP